MTRLTYPKFKSLINKGMSPDEVLKKVFKKYKGTIHDTLYWKNQIKRRINHYYKSRSIKKNKRKSRTKSKSRSTRRK
jgi:hypothetical protein